MKDRAEGTLPQATSQDRSQIHDIVIIWKTIHDGEHAGETTWETLDSIEFEVTSCLERGDLVRAKRLTARAIYLYEFGEG